MFKSLFKKIDGVLAEDAKQLKGKQVRIVIDDEI